MSKQLDLDLDLLYRLLETPAATGNEGEIQRLIAREFGDMVDDLQTDLHGNLYLGLNPDARRRVMIAAHCDQIGFMIKHIDDRGFAFFENLGGPDEADLPGSFVTIRGADGFVQGVIGKRAVHQESQDEREKTRKTNELWIDIGANSRKDAEKFIAPGCYATLSPRIRRLANNRIASGALDNRTGLFVALSVLERCARANPRVALYVVSTVQEEVGLRGAGTAAFHLNPDIAIAIDVTNATDDPSGSNKNAATAEIGGGPCISHGPNTNPGVEMMLHDAADRAGVRVQELPSAELEGNDAKSMQVAGAGVAVASVGIPNRYMHTGTEVSDLDCIQDTIELLTEFILGMDPYADLAPFRIPQAATASSRW
jgi:endoglucanase